jgi:hypothetical protein
MSNEEQDVAILRLVKQRFEAKKRKTLLENELRTAGQSLSEIGSALKSVNASGPSQETPEFILPQIDKAPSICRLERIKAMLEELRDTQKNLAQLNRSAADLGID